jgi:hypothetical protein
MIVVLSLPVLLPAVGLDHPILRARLHEKFNRGAENQAFLVESASTASTRVKAMAVEPQWTRGIGTTSSPPTYPPAFDRATLSNSPTAVGVADQQADHRWSPCGWAPSW